MLRSRHEVVSTPNCPVIHSMDVCISIACETSLDFSIILSIDYQSHQALAVCQPAQLHSDTLPHTTDAFRARSFNVPLWCCYISQGWGKLPTLSESPGISGSFLPLCSGHLLFLETWLAQTASDPLRLLLAAGGPKMVCEKETNDIQCFQREAGTSYISQVRWFIWTPIMSLVDGPSVNGTCFFEQPLFVAGFQVSQRWQEIAANSI